MWRGGSRSSQSPYLGEHRARSAVTTACWPSNSTVQSAYGTCGRGKRSVSADHGRSAQDRNKPGRAAAGSRLSARAAAVEIWDTDSGKKLIELPAGSAGYVYALAWHPDSRRLALGFDGSTGKIQIWDAADRRTLATLEGQAQWVYELAFHPGGDLLVSLSGDGTSRLWDAKTGRLLVNWPAAIGDLHFSPDGKVCGFAVIGGRARLMEVAEGREYRTFVRGSAPAKASIVRATSARTGSSPSAWTTGYVCGTSPQGASGFFAWPPDGLGELRRPPDGRELLTAFGWRPLADPRGPERRGAAADWAPQRRRLAHCSDTRPPSPRTVESSPWGELGDGTGRRSGDRGRAVHPVAAPWTQPRRDQPGRPVGGDERLA